MKAVSIVLLLAIVGSSLQQALPAPVQPTADANACSTTLSTNPNIYALKWLESKKVKLNTTPTTYTNTAICGGEWNTYKTCCDADSVREFIKVQNDEIVGRWKNYLAKIGRVRAKLLAGIKGLVSKITVEDTSSRWKMIEKFSLLASRLASVRMMLPTTQSQINLLKEWADKFEDNLKLFREQGKTCFETMKTTRASMLCAICSGRASTFSEAQSANNANFRMTLKGCKDVVNACYPIWKFNFGLTSIVQYVNTVKNAKKASDSNTIKFRNDAVVTEADTTNLKDTFASCNWASQNMTCNSTTVTVDEHAIRLCKIGLVINKENSITEGDENTVDDLGDGDAEEANQEVARPVNPVIIPIPIPNPTPINPKVIVQTARILQASDPQVGVAVSDANAYPGATSDSGLTPATTVESSSVGDAPSHAGILRSMSVLLVLVAVTLFSF